MRMHSDGTRDRPGGVRPRVYVCFLTHIFGISHKGCAKLVDKENRVTVQESHGGYYWQKLFSSAPPY
jgi:hypothetical protein